MLDTASPQRRGKGRERERDEMHTHSISRRCRRRERRHSYVFNTAAAADVSCIRGEISVQERKADVPMDMLEGRE